LTVSKHVLKAPNGFLSLKRYYDELLSTVAFNFNLRRYIEDQGAAMCGGEGWHVVRMQTWVVASPDQSILRPGERKWLGQTLGLDLTKPSPCFVRKRDTLTAANFINLCHAKEDQGGAGYVLVTVTELLTGRKIATRTIVADHDSMFTSMYELTTEQISPAVVDMKQRLNPDVKCDGASAAASAAAAFLGSSEDDAIALTLPDDAEGAVARTHRQLLGGAQPTRWRRGRKPAAPAAVRVRAAPPPPAGVAPTVPCYSGRAWRTLYVHVFAVFQGGAILE